MTEKPYEVNFPDPATVPAWEAEAEAWKHLAMGVLAESSTQPLTIKAFYVTGLIFHCAKSVDILLAKDNLTSTTFYPAYGVFASAVELIGRCIRGNSTTRETTFDLYSGFKWLARPAFPHFDEVSDDHVLLSTTNFPHSIASLVALRHFAAHGQAVNLSTVRDFDYLILGHIQPLFADSVERFLTDLASVETMAVSLARSSIAPFRSRPIWDGVWPFPMGRDEFPLAVGKAIRGMNWNYKDPLERLRLR